MDYENAIEIRNLTKKFDGFTLDNISFDVPKGSIMGFIGQNGAITHGGFRLAPISLAATLGITFVFFSSRY